MPGRRQLNVGEGKTRVMLPMLVLQLSDGCKVGRVTLLPALLGEAYGHLHRTLTASVLGVRLFELPFDRDITPGHADARAMLAAARCVVGAALMVSYTAHWIDPLALPPSRYCQLSRGLIVVTPQSRLSLELKHHELRSAEGQGEARAVLDELRQLPYVDLLDEVDEVLHHRQVEPVWAGCDLDGGDN